MYCTLRLLFPSIFQGLHCCSLSLFTFIWKLKYPCYQHKVSTCPFQILVSSLCLQGSCLWALSKIHSMGDCFYLRSLSSHIAFCTMFLCTSSRRHWSWLLSVIHTLSSWLSFYFQCYLTVECLRQNSSKKSVFQDDYGFATSWFRWIDLYWANGEKIEEAPASSSWFYSNRQQS